MTNPTKKRTPLIAFLLSIITPGLGHIYNGQLKKGILLLALLLLFPLLFGLTGITTLYFGVIVLFFIQVGLRLYAIIDATVLAVRQKDYALKPYNKWYFHLFIGMLMVGLFFVYPLQGILKVQTFKIPTLSMEPNIKAGDWTVADIDFDHKTIDYGDIVLFKPIDEDVFYVCRVVGLPNDKVQLQDNFIVINGQATNREFIETITVEGTETEVYEERFPNDKTISLYKNKRPPNPEMINTPERTIPADSYYLIGDNRDNALDSRYTGGVSKSRIFGRMLYTYWGATTDRIGIDLTKR